MFRLNDLEEGKIKTEKENINQSLLKINFYYDPR